MYLRKHWDVLLVDDEPDVLAVSRLVLKGIKVYDIPLRVHEFTSKEAAITYFRDRGELPDLALAILDVVMETDRAGLELCEYIRKVAGNRVTTIVVRTGQPGTAPEQEVTDQFDINEYISKVEATEEKLRHIAKTAIRQFLYSRSCEGMMSWLVRFSQARSRDALKRDLSERINSVVRTAAGETLTDVSPELSFLLGDEAIGAGEFADASKAKAMREMIAGTPDQKLRELMISKSGDRYARVGDHILMTAGAANRVPAHLVAHVTYTPMPDYLVRSFWSMLNGLANSWERLG